MGTGRQRRKGNTRKHKEHIRAMKAKHYQKHIDQIHEDIQPGNREKMESQDIDEDRPGLAQFYCVDCAKYFVNTNTLEVHLKTKGHKKQLKVLKETPYTIQDSIDFAK